MTRVDGALLWGCLLRPSRLETLTGAQLSDVLNLAWRQGVIFRLAVGADESGVLNRLPKHTQNALTDFTIEARYNARQLAWEVNRIAAALRGADYPVILLKGAAYHSAEFAFAGGRVSSDVDILVPKSCLSACQASLETAGWAFEEKSDYDDQYYREWMHELPPLRHKTRLTIMDLHHNILPPVARLTPNIQALIDGAVEASDRPLKRPSLPDMVVHSALHCFYDGDFTANIRSMLDLHDLFDLGLEANDDFLAKVIKRAELHDVKRPVADAMAMLEQLGSVSLDGAATRFVAQQRRIWPLEHLYKWSVQRRTTGAQPFKEDTWAARFLLYVRSHWITMPPGMLFKHLSRKALMRMKRKA